jgi:putative addiction module component (TIGR02574 family)
MIESRKIERMSIAERLQAIEQIWNSLYENGDEVPSPEWHREVLAERKARAESSEAKFLTLDQLRSRLRKSQS